MRARILYVPIFAAFEARQLAELLSDWADVESFDGPGTGPRRDEPPASIDETVEAGSQRLDELGWDRCVVVCDSHGQAPGALLALRDPRVKALAMGHAAMRYAVGGSAPTLNPGVHAAARQLLETDYRSFGRALTQLTQGTLDDAWVASFMEEVPAATARSRVFELAEGHEIASRLRDCDVELLLAGHRGCVMWTAEAFGEAVAALPAAASVECDDAPMADPAFHTALRSLCERVFG